jgi:hypothetical protein
LIIFPQHIIQILFIDNLIKSSNIKFKTKEDTYSWSIKGENLDAFKEFKKSFLPISSSYINIIDNKFNACSTPTGK